MSYHTERVAMRAMAIVAAAASWPRGAMALPRQNSNPTRSPKTKQGDAQQNHAHPANHQRQGRRKPPRQPEGDPQRSEPPPQTKPAGWTGENDPPPTRARREGKAKGPPNPTRRAQGRTKTRHTEPEGRPKADTHRPHNGKDAPHSALNPQHQRRAAPTNAPAQQNQPEDEDVRTPPHHQ